MKNKKIKKIIILGSGALKIGEAGEFDYSGSQAIKALKEENLKVVLVNPNIATIQTSEYLADKVYFLPVNQYFVEQVIKKERPDGILLSFGGQTALNCGLNLWKNQVLKKYHVKVLGTPVQAIENTEDRWLFVQKLKAINCLTPQSRAITSLFQAIQAARHIRYPVMVRNAFSLGGQSSGAAYNQRELENLVKRSLAITQQVLIEEYLGGWKEVEYEVVRDSSDNCITVCNMENFDPMGIHTGESIVVAPSQTLDNYQYHWLREISIKVVRRLGIVGECNIQFALNPRSNEYRIIEVNARLSRSSALASKATGYPLAFIAAKLALGYSLTELKNSVTKITSACFEPALDYIVIKIPRWDLKKFRQVSKIIGSEMKSVGEVMAIGRCFEEALQKALRMLNIGVDGLVANQNQNHNNYQEEIKKPTPDRIFAIARALQNKVPLSLLYRWSSINPWFLSKMQNIVVCAKKMHEIKKLDQELIREAKQYGFSDVQIGRIINISPWHVRKFRLKKNIVPVIKQIDTLGAEYPAKTNYLYVTYNGEKNDISLNKKNQLARSRQVIVLGSGAYCIGSSVEFDWCCVNTVLTLRKLGYKAIMINCNPETVSTDYDECDKLYFEELTFERILDIYDAERPMGVIVSMGGQIPNNLALKLSLAKVKILGTSGKNIDRSEDRHKFSKLCDELHIDQPLWQECRDLSTAEQFALRVGYPVLVRPSYVLSGAAMSIAFNAGDLKNYLTKAAQVNEDYPVVVSKFISGAKEIEIDAVANRGKLINWVITEHVENAGVHSGDATIIMPAQKIYIETMRRIKDIAKQIAKKLQITGPFNIQFLAKDNKVKVIETNLRASRTLPFVTKVSKINLIAVATKIQLGYKVVPYDFKFILDYIGIKAPQFSFSRLSGADPLLTVEMSSTGEVACFGDTIEEAYLKSLLSTGFRIPEKSILLSLRGIQNQSDFLPSAQLLKEKGFNLYATQKTSEFLKHNNISTEILYNISEDKKPNIKNFIENRKIELVINISDLEHADKIYDDYLIRRKSVDFNIPIITNLQAARLFVSAITNLTLEDLKIKSWDEYK